MKSRVIRFAIATTVALLRQACGQGFVNLDFESAAIAPTPVGGHIFPADPAQAFPGWVVGGPNTTVAYNAESIGGPMVSLIGPAFPNYVGYASLQGSYSVQLYYFSAYGVPTLSQTGKVPVDARSINFLVRPDQDDGVVTLNGVAISLVAIGGGRLAGDVTSFAGTVAQLKFSTVDIPFYPDKRFYFDDIQFSPTPIPEPTNLSLIALCIALFGWRATRQGRPVVN